MSPDDQESPDQLEIKRQEHLLLKDVKHDFNKLLPEVMKARMAEQSVLAQSAVEGGPSNVHEALLHMLNESKIGVRELARCTGVKRKPLLSMIEGRMDMPVEVRSKIISTIKQKQPQLFDF